MRAAEVVLTDEQRATLRGWLGAGKTERRTAFRAEVILAIAEGLSNKVVAERLGTRLATVRVKAGPAVVDFISGIHLYAATVTALFERERTGRGRLVEVAMQEAA
jgi:crotonobetainyl-CoA:carnitine CoA-transferase CaiB-like acyl-CoA transferase